MSSDDMRDHAAPEPPGPPEGPPEPPLPDPTTRAMAPAPAGMELALPGGMPGQREGRPTTISEAALQITLKWMDHMSDAAELALGDAELAEAQAHSVVMFYRSIFGALKPHFPAPSENGRQREQR